MKKNCVRQRLSARGCPLKKSMSASITTRLHNTDDKQLLVAEVLPRLFVVWWAHGREI